MQIKDFDWLEKCHTIDEWEQLLLADVMELEYNCWEKTTDKELNWTTTAHYRIDSYARHAVSYILYNGDIPEGQVVRHICNNARCFNPDHLVLGTPSENNADKLKTDTVWFIHKLFQQGVPLEDLANILQIPKVHIWAVVTGRAFRGTWKRIVNSSDSYAARNVSIAQQPIEPYFHKKNDEEYRKLYAVLT